jgi:hypothetical protein
VLLITQTNFIVFKHLFDPKSLLDLERLLHQEQARALELHTENKELQMQLQELGQGLMISERELNKALEVREHELQELQMAFHEQAENNMMLSDKARDQESLIENLTEETQLYHDTLEKYRTRLETMQQDAKSFESQRAEQRDQLRTLQFQIEELRETLIEKDELVAKMKLESSGQMEEIDRKRREVIRARASLQTQFALAKRTLLAETRKLKQETRDTIGSLNNTIAQQKQLAQQQAEHMLLLMSRVIEKRINSEREGINKVLANKKLELKALYKAKQETVQDQVKAVKEDYAVELGRVKAEAEEYRDRSEKLAAQCERIQGESETVRRENQKFLEIMERAREEITFLHEENAR